MPSSWPWIQNRTYEAKPERFCITFIVFYQSFIARRFGERRADWVHFHLPFPVIPGIIRLA